MAAAAHSVVDYDTLAFVAVLEVEDACCDPGMSATALEEAGGVAAHGVWQAAVFGNLTQMRRRGWHLGLRWICRKRPGQR